MKIWGAKNLGTGIAIGVGAALVLPVVGKVLAGAAKPLVKESIKGGMVVAEKTKVLFAEAKETIDDLTAEAKSELKVVKPAKAASK